ncbi:hypothetical protein [Streptomyces sanglieri]|uniref:hypothetical protein n=1 Tax=Streptomyces sanglieri TaxID=193460 RepID=UPI003523B18A
MKLATIRTPDATRAVKLEGSVLVDFGEADLPASVLADFTGTSISNATRWAGYARRDWFAYIASRTQI